jgi:hypothetical protein
MVAAPMAARIGRMDFLTASRKARLAFSIKFSCLRGWLDTKSSQAGASPRQTQSPIPRQRFSSIHFVNRT